MTWFLFGSGHVALCAAWVQVHERIGLVCDMAAVGLEVVLCSI